MDCSLPGSSIHGIVQARILEWVAIFFSRRSSPPRDPTRVSRIVDRRFTIWATRETTNDFSHTLIQSIKLCYQGSSCFSLSPSLHWLHCYGVPLSPGPYPPRLAILMQPALILIGFPWNVGQVHHKEQGTERICYLDSLGSYVYPGSRKVGVYLSNLHRQTMEIRWFPKEKERERGKKKKKKQDC